MTAYAWGEPKMNEKTWPVNVGASERDMLLAIQAKIRERLGYEVTHRAIIARAIHMLYDAVSQDAPKGD